MVVHLIVIEVILKIITKNFQLDKTTIVDGKWPNKMMKICNSKFWKHCQNKVSQVRILWILSSLPTSLSMLLYRQRQDNNHLAEHKSDRQAWVIKDSLVRQSNNRKVLSLLAKACSKLALDSQHQPLKQHHKENLHVVNSNLLTKVQARTKLKSNWHNLTTIMLSQLLIYWMMEVLEIWISINSYSNQRKLFSILILWMKNLLRLTKQH